MDCFGSFFLIDRGFTFWVFALEWGLFFVCEEWKICFYWRWFIVYFREDLLSTQEGRVLNWEGIYDYIAERFNCLFLPGIGFCWEGIHLVHGDFFEGGFIFCDVFLLDEYIGGKRLHHYIHSKSSDPSPFHRQPSGCKASWVQGIAKMEDSRWNGWNCSWQWKGLKNFHKLLSISHKKNNRWLIWKQIMIKGFPTAVEDVISKAPKSLRFTRSSFFPCERIIYKYNIYIYLPPAWLHS